MTGEVVATVSSATVDLTGQLILLTGAHGTIGSAVASAIASSGGQVILAGKVPRKLDRLYDQIVQAGGVEPVSLPIDLVGSGPDEFAQVGEAIGTQFGRLDGLVHLASSFKGRSPLSAAKPQEWAETLHIALNAPLLLHQAVYPWLSKAPQPKIIFALERLSNVSSAYWGAYGVAKHALHGMVSILADELESSGAKVFGVIPPPVRSKLRQNLFMGVDPAKPVAAKDVAHLWTTLLADLEDRPSGYIVDGSRESQSPTD